MSKNKIKIEIDLERFAMANRGTVTVRQIAQKYGITNSQAGKILSKLVRNGLAIKKTRSIYEII